jgi:hypothetical protein
MGCYIGPVIDTGPYMARDALRVNGKMMHMTSVRSQSLDELQIHDELQWDNEFDTAIKMKLGPKMMADDSKLDPACMDFETPTNDTYE